MPGFLGAIRSRIRHRSKAPATASVLVRAPLPAGPLPATSVVDTFERAVPPEAAPKPAIRATQSPVLSPAPPPHPVVAGTPLVAHVLSHLHLRAGDGGANYQHRVLPNLLATAFPVDNVDVDLGDATAFLAISFALRDVLPTLKDPPLQACLERRIAELERAARLAHDLLNRKPLTVLLSSQVLTPLAHHAAVLVPGGYLEVKDKRTDGHAVSLYFRPNVQTGKTRIAVCNRSQGDHPYHAHDWRQRRMPLLMEVSTQKLLDGEAHPILLKILSLQRPAKGNALPAFYDAVGELVSVCNGVILCGRSHAVETKKVSLTAQTAQKGGTCSWHSAWAWLRTAMQLDLEGQMPRRRLSNSYKMLKRHARAVILDNALQALKTEDVAQSKSPLRQQLSRSRTWLVRHVIYDASFLNLYSTVFFALRTSGSRTASPPPE